MVARMPAKDKHLSTAEIKCFMMAKNTHDSHLVDKKLCKSAIEKIKTISHNEECSNFKYNSFV